MVMPIYNDLQLEVEFNSLLETVIENTTKEILDILKDQFVQGQMYNKGKPNVYQRTGQFKRSWVKTNTSRHMNETSSKIFSDPTKMTYDGDMFQHGSRLSGNISDALAEILNEGKVGSFFDYAITASNNGWWHDARPFWDMFIQLLDSGKVFEIMEKEFTKVGIAYNRI